MIERIISILEELLWPMVTMCTVILLVLIFHFVLFRILTSVTKKTDRKIDDMFINRLGSPTRWFMVAIAIRLAIPLFEIPVGIFEFIKQLFGLVTIGLVAWLLINALRIAEDYIRQKFDVGVKDNLSARKIHTQFNVIRRIAIIMIFIVTLGAALMTFEKVRQLGTTIIASAGIVGLIVGMAAQKTLGNFIAGIQIALTQPIRVDDVVIVENEWGRIEEITLTYVVVKIWDLRRLIVPITYFIDKPFQNWTRVTADILGSVFIYTDHTIPVDVIREKLTEILNGSEHWDRKVCVLQVTNTTEKSIELRALISAGDASTAWTLRCEVREKLVTFIQQNYPQCLPKFRAELDQIDKSYPDSKIS